MANIKISQLIAAGAASDTQEFEVNDSGTSKKVTGSQIKTYVKDGFVVSDVEDLTATAAELNTLDGITASTAELNTLTGLTASTAELNILDGVTASTAELNVLDGVTGLASQVQAEAGTNNTTVMTPLRSAQAIAALAKPSYGTEVASTSGTSIAFTGIPSSATRIGMILNGVVTSANSNLLVQLGTSAGYVTTGYVGAFFTQGGNTSVTGGLASFNNNTGVSNSGIALWIKVGAGTDWVGNLTVGNTGNSSASGSSIAVGGTVDRIRVTTANGTYTFTAGAINIFWE